MWNGEIRPATRADVADLGRLGALMVEMHNTLDPQRFIEGTPETARGYGGYLGSQLGERDVVILVAVDGGSVIGFAYCALEGIDYMSLRGPAGIVHDILVDPARRSGGVGRVLLDAAIAELRRRGAPRIVLSTAARNDGARRFFARAGFRETMIELTRELDDG